MLKRNLLVSTICMGLGLAGYALPAQAQTLDSEGVAYSEQYHPEPLRNVNITLTRDVSLMPGQFIIHAEEGGAYSSGCAELSQIPVEVEYLANFLRLTYHNYILDSRDQLKGTGTTCNKPMSPPTAKVILDSAMLAAKGIEKIRFMYHGQPIEADLELSDQRVRMWPALSREGLADMQVGNIKTVPSTVWFYPENTVILSVPGAKTEQELADLREKVDRLATSRGLSPLEDHLTGFKSPLKDKTAFYYVAKGDRYSQAQGELLDYVSVDSVKFGLEADEPIQKPLAVHIRRPRPTE
ncbi:MAG: hypothetical protein HYS17_04825 [Micavibrio aeruginosavorus]|uniref:Uncharacterized protein n=1 Tax=Micavibrio aeruginosavorus TaxID=349221 RepID=A0A7T5R400_9BACT|nr:MAG: hypothetical protein HYS17_04825 [Micavibrio aeruginosavorus]